MGARLGLRAALAGAVSLLLAAGALPTAPVVEPEAGALWGYVAFDDTDMLAGDGEVQVDAIRVNGSTYESTTDSAGRFVFNGLPAGSYKLRFSGVGGYPHQYYEAFAPTIYSEHATRITVPTTGDPIAMRLSPSGVVSGRVSLGSSGNWAGAGDVEVTLRFCDSGEDPCDSDPPYQTTLTEADGTFRFDVAYEDYSLAFEYVGGDGYTHIRDDRFTDARLDGYTYLSAGHDVVMPAAAYLEGTITLDGEPAGLGDIELSVQQPGFSASVVGVDENGGYRFGRIAAGQAVSVTVDYLGAGDYLDSQFTAYLGAAGTMTTQDFDLSSGSRIAGRVTDSAGEGFSAGTVVVSKERDFGDYRAYERYTTIDLPDDGTWSLTQVPPGDYKVHVGVTSCSPPVPCWVDTDWRDPVTGSYAFSVAADQAVTGLDVTVSRGATVTGAIACDFCPGGSTPPTSLVRQDEFTGEWSTLYRATGFPLPITLIEPGTYRVLTASMYGAAEWSSEPFEIAEGATHDLGTIAVPRTSLLVRSSDGVFGRYPAVNGKLGARVKLSTGYTKYTKIVDAGDVDADGYPDLYQVDKSGVLWFRGGVSGGTYGAAVKIATGWSAYKHVLAFADLDHDGWVDLVAQGTSNTLYFFPGTGDGRLGPRQTIGSSAKWGGFTLLASNGHQLIARAKSGTTYLYQPTYDQVTFVDRQTLTTKWATVTQIVYVGAFDSDGWGDYIVRTSKGSLVLWRGTGQDASLVQGAILAKSWYGRLLT